MKFDTPATQPTRSTSSRSSASPPTASTARSRPPAPRPTPMSATTSCRTGLRLRRRRRRSPRAASPRWTCGSQGRARRARHRDRRGMPASSHKGKFNTAQPARRPRDRALSPGDRRRRGRDVRAGRDAAAALRVEYAREPTAASTSPPRHRTRKPTPADSGEGSGGPAEDRVGDFEGAFARARSSSTQTYTTPDESHAMMEPHAIDRGLGRRQAHGLDVEPDDRLGQARPRQDARDFPRRRSGSISPVYRRRLRRQAVPARRRGAGGARRARPRAARSRSRCRGR